MPYYFTHHTYLLLVGLLDRIEALMAEEVEAEPSSYNPTPPSSRSASPHIDMSEDPNYPELAPENLAAIEAEEDLLAYEQYLSVY